MRFPDTYHCSVELNALDASESPELYLLDRIVALLESGATTESDPIFSTPSTRGKTRMQVLREGRGMLLRELDWQADLGNGRCGQIELRRLVPAPGSVMLKRIALVLGWPEDDADALLDEGGEPGDTA